MRADIMPPEQLSAVLFDTDLGPAMLAASARGVVSIDFADDATALHAALAARHPTADIVVAETTLRGWAAALAAFLKRPTAALEFPLDPAGTPFQRRVWEALCAIPVGTTTTYAALAVRLGLPATAARAVGTACAANPIAVAIPCHRVVRSDGGLGGYRWGVERKRLLLLREGGHLV